MELASRIRSALPSCEKKVRVYSQFGNRSDDEHTVRLARAATGRDLIHQIRGVAITAIPDSFLSEAGSGLATLGIAACPGVPQALAALTLNAPYNDIVAVEKLFDQHPDKIAAIIVRLRRGQHGGGCSDAGLPSGDCAIWQLSTERC